MLHCEKYDDSREPYGIPIKGILKPKSEDDILNIKVTISAKSRKALIYLAQDETLTESTVAYEIALGTKTTDVCEIGLRNQHGFTELHKQPCTISKNSTINIIAKANGIISVADGPETFILKASAQEVLPFKTIKYVFFSPLGKMNNRFYYNCYDQLKECNTYSSKERGYNEYFPIEDVRSNDNEYIIVDFPFIVWAKKRDAYVQLTTTSDQDHPKIELKIKSNRHGYCSLQIEKRYNHDSEILYRQECSNVLSLYEPVQVRVTIYKSRHIHLTFETVNFRKLFMGQITTTDLIPIKYISFRTHNYLTKYFFSCWKRL